jgi:hypothetical protein
MQEQLIKVGLTEAAAFDGNEAGFAELGHEADNTTLPYSHIGGQPLLAWKSIIIWPSIV